jgi:3-dehydroquinate dehydratase-1
MNYKQLSNKNLCVSIANKNFNECLEIAKNSDLVELRLDLLELNFDELKELFKLDAKFIITHRLGGFINEQASSFLKNIIDLDPDYIDVEIEQENKYIDSLIDYAKNTNCKIIFSYHNYEHTPSKIDLQSIIDNAKKQNVAYVKIATQVTSQTDVARILSLYENNDKLIAFGIGEIGRISRVACLYLGAEFTYVSTDKNNETASGQLTKEEMNTIFGII